MEFKGPRAESILGTIGEGAGYSISVCIFLTAAFLIAGRWGLHSAPLTALLPVYATVIALGVAISALALTEAKKPAGSPKDLAEGIRRGMMFVGHRVSDAVNFALLSVLYFTGVGIVSIVSKASGKKFLDTRFKTEGTYYVKIDKGGGKAEDYLRQF